MFQDIAVIPMLALIPLLALPDLVAKTWKWATSEGATLRLIGTATENSLSIFAAFGITNSTEV